MGIDTGWLDRSGRFYLCEMWEHSGVPSEMGCTDSELEERGWVRLWGVGESPEFSSERRLSAEQRNWMSRMGFCLEDYD